MYVFRTKFMDVWTRLKPSLDVRWMSRNSFSKMLCIESLSCRLILVTEGYIHISPWVLRTYRYETMFLCCIQKDKKCRTESLLNTWKSQKHLSKWIKRYFNVKNIDDLPDCGSVQKTKKEDRVILLVFEKNPRLSLRDGQAIMRKKGLNILFDARDVERAHFLCVLLRVSGRIEFYMEERRRRRRRRECAISCLCKWK